MKKFFAIIGQLGIFFALSLFISPVFAYERCRYPIRQVKYLYKIIDTTGFSNVNLRETLRNAKPTITCVVTGSTPECSTPWKGLVDVHLHKWDSGQEFFWIWGFRDKSNNKISFGINTLWNEQISTEKRVAKCGSIAVGGWVKNDIGGSIYTGNYEISGDSRNMIVGKEKYTIYGSPSRISQEGNRGNF